VYNFDAYTLPSVKQYTSFKKKTHYRVVPKVMQQCIMANEIVS